VRRSLLAIVVVIVVAWLVWTVSHPSGHGNPDQVGCIWVNGMCE
jgi:hypothetical protein